MNPVLPMVHVRHAIIALNLTATKTEDGIVRFIAKGHISAIASKEMSSTVKAAEEHLAAARSFLLELLKNNRISHEQYVEVLGLLRLRYGAYLTKTGKMTFEQNVYNSGLAVVAAFLKDVKDSIEQHDSPGAKVDIPACLRPAMKLPSDALIVQVDSAKKKVQAPKEADKALTLDEANSWDQAAKRKGFKVGVIVAMKKSESKRMDGIWKIRTIGAQIELDELDSFKDSLLYAKIEFTDFLKQWALYGGDVSTGITGEWTIPVLSHAADVEVAKAKLFGELHAVIKSNEDPPISSIIIPTFKPFGLRVKRDVKKGEIVIYPIPLSVSHITTKFSDSAAEIISPLIDPATGDHVKFYIPSAPKPPTDDAQAWKENQCVTPWGWVVEDDSASLQKKTFSQDGFCIPYLENNKAMKKFSKLTVSKGTLKRKADQL